MSIRYVFAFTFLTLGFAGCSVAPVSYEESLRTDRATRNDVVDWEAEIRYRVGFQYANAARRQLADASVDIPPDMTTGFQVPFAIWDYTQGDSLGAGIGFLDWFNSGLSKDSRYSYYYNQSLGRMGNPNTHYFTFDERPGSPSADDVHAAWNEAQALFTSIHNRGGECYVHGFSEKDQYRRTFSKDVPAKYKIIAYRCRHPLFTGEELRVTVSAWAHPFEGVRVMGAVESQCYVKPPRGEDFVDVRPCGLDLANRQRSRIPSARFGWIELVVTPIEASPSEFEVIARQGDFVTRLPAPAATEEYKAFLASREYRPH